MGTEKGKFLSSFQIVDIQRDGDTGEDGNVSLYETYQHAGNESLQERYINSQGKKVRDSLSINNKWVKEADRLRRSDDVVGEVTEFKSLMKFDRKSEINAAES